MDGSNYMIKANLVENQEEYYEKTLKLSFLNTFKTTGKLNPTSLFFNPKEVLAKLFKIISADKTYLVFFPLDHTYLQ